MIPRRRFLTTSLAALAKKRRGSGYAYPIRRRLQLAIKKSAYRQIASLPDLFEIYFDLAVRQLKCVANIAAFGLE